MKQEEWRRISGEHRHLYWVSNYGEVSDSDGNVLKEYIEDGYKYVKLKNESRNGYTRRRVHLLVLDAFLLRRNGKYIAKHIGKREDNRLENLEWITPTGRFPKKRIYKRVRADHMLREEIILARKLYRKHRSSYKVRNEMSIPEEGWDRYRTMALRYTTDLSERETYRSHSEETRARCIELYRQGKRSGYIERETGVFAQSILDWAREEGLEVARLAKLDAEKVREIRKMHGVNCGNGRLAKKFGVSKSTIAQVIKGRTWKHVK